MIWFKEKNKNFLKEGLALLNNSMDFFIRIRKNLQSKFFLQATSYKLKDNKGFTLVEMIVAVAIFSIVMVMALGALLAVINANKQNQAIQTAVNNLSLSLETLSREMRVGSRYHCGSVGEITDPQNCLAGSDYISFLSFEGKQIVYKLNDSRIERSDEGGDSGTFLFLTAPVVVIENLMFYVTGAGSGDDIQPRVLITVSGYVDLGSVGERGKSYFDLQTTASQRLVDFE